jgi:hypothetical protein
MNDVDKMTKKILAKETLQYKPRGSDSASLGNDEIEYVQSGET